MLLHKPVMPVGCVCGGKVRHGPGGWVKDAPYFNQADSVIPVVTFLTPLA